MTTDTPIAVWISGPGATVRVGAWHEWSATIYDAEFVNMLLGGGWPLWHYVQLAAGRGEA